jgi:hypothetical protein
MQVRRGRTERLLLVPSDGGATVELASAGRVAGAVDSQDELAASPDGKYLAWTMSGDDRLHLRDAEGHERSLARYAHKMRFSSDGRWLAAVTEVGRGDWQKLIAWELATGRIQPLLTADRVGRFEWARGGLVVAQHDELLHASLAGGSRSLFKAAAGEHLQRFTAATTSSRVVVVVETERGLKVRSLELDHPDRIRELGSLPGARVDNAEQSPDGDRIVLATSRGLYVVDGDAAPRELSGKQDVHSLWFAPDGRLAYASPVGATVLDGKRTRRLESRDPIHMIRFEKGSARVLVASGRDVRAWDPATGQKPVLASAPQGDQLLGVEGYQGGVVLWTGHDGTPKPHRIVRVLRVTRDGTTAELDRLEGELAANSAPYIGSSFFTTSADGRSALFRTSGGFRVRADGKERAIAASRAVLSPRGDQVLVGRSETPPTTVSWSLLDTATGAERRVFQTQAADLSAEVAFSGDGNWLAINRTEQGHIVLVMIEVATGKERTIPVSESRSFSWTARGLLSWGSKGLALVSTSGALRTILDEPVEGGLARVATSGASRVLVCFRGGSAGDKVHPGLVSLDLDAPGRAVELDVPNCWNRATWLSGDGEQVVVSGYGAFATATNELSVVSARGGAPGRGLGEGYNEVVFDGRRRLAFVSHRGVKVLDGKRDDLFETDGPVEALQFAKDSSLVFAIGREVIGWDPSKGPRTVLARAPEGQRILAAAATSDGFLLATVE